jgi:ADP-ribose pyrophosphatase YjhB (NUDIX family)
MGRLPPSLHRAALRVYRGLPVRWRRRVVRAMTPRYTMGALVVLRDGDDRLLLVHQRYTRAWALPGGLVNRHEPAEVAAARELREETGLRLAVDRIAAAEPNALVHPARHWVDMVYTGLAADADGDLVVDGVEIVEAAWYAPDALPPVTWPTAQILTTCGFATAAEVAPHT